MTGEFAQCELADVITNLFAACSSLMMKQWPIEMQKLLENCQIGNNRQFKCGHHHGL